MSVTRERSGSGSGSEKSNMKAHRKANETMEKHSAFIRRVEKSMYYGQMPNTECFSLPVSELASELFSESQKKCSLQRLEIHEAASLSRNACVSPCSLVVAMLYLERLQTCNPAYVCSMSPSELYLVSLMVASKFLHDGENEMIFNDEWAASAKISTKHINKLEVDFLQAIDWDIYVSEDTFWTRLRDLEQKVALSEGSRRGWFTYSDLELLLDKLEIGSLTQTLLTVSVACLTSYAASVLTLIGSALLVGQLHTLSGVNMAGLTTAPSTVLSSQPNELPSSANPAHVTDESPLTNITSDSAAPAVLLATTLLTSVGSYGNFSQECGPDDESPHCTSRISDSKEGDWWSPVESWSDWLDDADLYIQTLRGWLRWSVDRGSFVHDSSGLNWLDSLNHGNRFPIEVY